MQLFHSWVCSTTSMVFQRTMILSLVIPRNLCSETLPQCFKISARVRARRDTSGVDEPDIKETEPGCDILVSLASNSGELQYKICGISPFCMQHLILT